MESWWRRCRFGCDFSVVSNEVARKNKTQEMAAIFSSFFPLRKES